MSDLLKAQLSTLIRKIILIAATAMLAHHVDAATVNAITALFDPASIAAELVAAGTVAWSALENKKANTKIVLAAATGATTATPTTSDTVLIQKAIAPSGVQIGYLQPTVAKDATVQTVK